jgi:hypothetical protein
MAANEESSHLTFSATLLGAGIDVSWSRMVLLQAQDRQWALRARVQLMSRADRS